MKLGKSRQNEVVSFPMNILEIFANFTCNKGVIIRISFNLIGHFLDLRIVQNLGKIYIVRGNYPD